MEVATGRGSLQDDRHTGLFVVGLAWVGLAEADNRKVCTLMQDVGRLMGTDGLVKRSSCDSSLLGLEDIALEFIVGVGLTLIDAGDRVVQLLK